MMTRGLRCGCNSGLPVQLWRSLCTSFGVRPNGHRRDHRPGKPDPSGAVVVGAHVTAENTATAVKTPTHQWVRDLHHPLSAIGTIPSPSKPRGSHSEVPRLLWDRPHS